MIEKLLDKWHTVFLANFAILFAFYHKVLLDLNGFVFAPTGDGIKNYYTYMFQAKYGTSFWDFKGMNYPFYEHIVFTDAHPLLAYLVGKMGMADYGVGILNFFMLISYPIAAVIIHRIFKHYNVNGIWAFVAAITICFLSPQVFRLTGHLSLSYVFAIPLMWYLILKTEQHKYALWPIMIFLVLVLFFFTHPYLGLILAVFGLFYALVFWFFSKTNWKVLFLKIVLPILASVGSFQALVTLTDTHTDRMKNPSGFFEMYASWKSLLFPHHGPVNDLKEAIGFKEAEWETWTYLGLFVIGILFFIIGYYLKNRNALNLKELAGSPVGKMYIAAHLVLLFAFCFPLKFNFLRWVVDVLGPLQQFRVLGRFAWVYFYVASVLSIVVLHRVMQQSQKKRLFQVFFVLGIGFSFLELIPVHLGVSKAISRQKNPFIYSNLSAEEQDIVSWTNQQNYQAILFLPFTHLSSENIFLMGTEKANYHSFLLSYHTHLPLLNTVTSRTSVTEAIAFHNLFAPEFVEKTFHHLLPDSANVMLVKNRGVLNPNELRMMYSSEKIYDNAEFTTYDFSFQKWNHPKYFRAVEKKFGQAVHPVGGGWLADTSRLDFVYESFDGTPEKNSFRGDGALAGQKSGIHSMIDSLKLTSGTYICSFWYNFRIDRADQEAIIEQTFKSGKGEWVAKNNIRQSNHIIGDWAMVEIPFTVSDSVVNTKVFLAGNHSKKWFIVDELLIRKEDDAPLFKAENWQGQPYIVYNNFMLRKNSFSE